MKSAIEVISYDKCTGCYGCLNKCPVDGAIEFKKTEEGFYKPFLTEKCVQCGLCQKGCPVITKVNRNNPEEIEVYSAWSKDNEILMNSSSGGIFSELAKVYLENNDVVFGAKWQDGEIVHCGITELDKLSSLQKSKYLQSKINDSYREVKNYLNEGRKVLFVGTPCEIAALNTIVGHENLVTVDIVCHGIPSYVAYEKYIKETFNKDIDEIEVDFRNKKQQSWEKYDIVFKSNNQILTRNRHGKDIFFRGFLADIYLNTPCYNCEFRTMPRVADITLGDFWGVPENLKGPNGTSVVTLNNEKGKELFGKIIKNIELKKADYQLALKGNPCLYNYKMDNSKRANFFKDINMLSFNELHKKYFPHRNNVYIYSQILFKILKKIYKKIKSKSAIVTPWDLKKIEKYSQEYPNVLNIKETIDWIIENRGSISRFGDGELDICIDKYNGNHYQEPSENLRNRLLEILNYKNKDKFMVCIPSFNPSRGGENFYGKLSFWEHYWLKKYEYIKPLLRRKNYGNSFLTRSVAFYEVELEQIKKIWEGRDVVFVYGNNGRFKIKNNLFGNISKYDEIKVAPTNAFKEYENILNECLKYNKNRLFLLAIGQTATVLAFDLYKNGYQAIDIGHFPNSYDQYLGKITSPESIPLIKENI